ncbi:MAG: glycosyltransferase family 4 protein [Clostridiales bacterium]|nr:glycosyltransferase family 4 protein [Clostridiales bacterium]
MKVVFTVATYYPKTDGVQFVTKYQAEGLVKKGFEVVVITSRIDGVPIEEKVNGVLIKRVDAFNYYYWHRGSKRQYQNTVLSEVKNAKALIAVCLQSFAADWLLDILDEISCKKILYLHGMPDFKIRLSDCKTIKQTAKTIFRNIRWQIFYSMNLCKIKDFDAIIHLFKNDNSYKYFSKHGYANNYVLENACDDVFFENIDAKKQEDYFIYVGNYCDRKNQELALKAFYQAKIKNMGMIFIGSTENAYCTKLKKLNEQLSSEYGTNNVLILHNVPREDISVYTRNAYACIISSSYEYYPITIIESLASGIPFISTDTGIIRYLPGGIIANNLNDIAYWMEFLAINKDYKNGLGKLGKEYAKLNLQIETKVAALEKIILN